MSLPNENHTEEKSEDNSEEHVHLERMLIMQMLVRKVKESPEGKEGAQALLREI